MSVIFIRTFLFSFSAFMVFNHALYISVLEIKNERAKTELILRIFPDDLRDAIRADVGDIIAQEANVLSSDDQALINDYISDKLEIQTISGIKLKINLQSVVAVGDAWEIKLQADQMLTGNVRISNKLLIEIFPTQNNIVKASESRPALLRFTNVNTAQELSFKE